MTGLERLNQFQGLVDSNTQHTQSQLALIQRRKPFVAVTVTILTIVAAIITVTGKGHLNFEIDYILALIFWIPVSFALMALYSLVSTMNNIIRGFNKANMKNMGMAYDKYGKKLDFGFSWVFMVSTPFFRAIGLIFTITTVGLFFVQFGFADVNSESAPVFTIVLSCVFAISPYFQSQASAFSRTGGFRDAFDIVRASSIPKAMNIIIKGGLLIFQIAVMLLPLIALLMTYHLFYPFNPIYAVIISFLQLLIVLDFSGYFSSQQSYSYLARTISIYSRISDRISDLKLHPNEISDEEVTQLEIEYAGGKEYRLIEKNILYIKYYFLAMHGIYLKRMEDV